MREEFKVIELAGKEWRIGKLDALTGNFLALKLIGKLGHILAGVASGMVADYKVIFMSALTELGNFTEHELYAIQATALSVCCQVTNVGGQATYLPVRTTDGRWAVADLGNDVITVLALTAHGVAFNLLPFFEGEALKQVLESFRSYSIPFALQTSTGTPTPP